MTTSAGLLLWMTGVLAGSMLFFGVVVAPQVFRTLRADAAGRFLRALFPGYYLWGLVVCVTASGVAFFADKVSGTLCVVIAVLFVFARQWLMPQINQARDGALAGSAASASRFERLHRLSVSLNGLQIVVLLMIASRLVWWTPAA